MTRQGKGISQFNKPIKLHLIHRIGGEILPEEVRNISRIGKELVRKAGGYSAINEHGSFTCVFQEGELHHVYAGPPRVDQPQ